MDFERRLNEGPLRVAPLWSAEHTETALRRVLAARRRAQDLIDVGAYQPGADPLVDAALAHDAAIAAFLQQGLDEIAPAAESWARLAELVGVLGATPVGLGAAA